MISDQNKETKKAKFPLLPIVNKLEIFRHIMDNTKGEDLKQVMWLKSPNSAIWLERRIHNFTIIFKQLLYKYYI